VTPDSGEPRESGHSRRATAEADTAADPLEVIFDDGRRAAVGTAPATADPAADVEAGAGETVDAPPATPVRQARLRRLRPVLRRLATPGLLAAAWAAATVMMLVRPAGIPPWRSIWAEDGSRFLPGGITRPGPGAWLEPYAGYRHLVPRMIGDLAARFPLVDAPVVLAVASSVVAGAALVVFAVGLRRWLPATWMQAGVVLAVAATHAMASEIAANAANLHWYLTLGLVGFALMRPRHVRTAVVAAAVAAAFALSDPFSPFVAVLALLDAGWRTATRRRTRRAMLATWPVPLAMTAGAVTQVLTMASNPRTPPPFAELPRDDLLSLYVQHVVRAGLSPGPLSHLSNDTLLLVVSASAAVLLGLAVAAAGARRRPGSNAVIGVILVAASPAVFVLNVSVNHTVADRYAAAPVALLVAGLLVLASGVPRVGTWVFLAACAGVATLGLVSFTTHPVRGDGPDFVAQVRAAAATACATPGHVVRIQVSPVSTEPHAARWFTELPCDRITTGPLDPPLP
jgi:hypothetical protein